MVWWIMYTTRNPDSVGPAWTAELTQSEQGQYVFGKIWMDPDNERINYLINVQNVRSLPRTAMFQLQSEHPDFSSHRPTKRANFALHGNLLTIAGHWDGDDLYTPLDDIYKQALFDQGLELIITTDNKPAGEMVIRFNLTQTPSLSST